MSMRGPIVAAAVVLIVLVLGSPFAIGMITENGLRQQMDIYAGNPAVAASVESYERGWFGSSVRLEFGFSDQYLSQLSAIDPSIAMIAPMLEELSLPIIVEISHGPILTEDVFGVGGATVRAHVDPESPIVGFAEDVLGLPYLFEFRGRSGFGTGFRFEGEIPAAANAYPDMSYEFSGLEFSGVTQDGDMDLQMMLDELSLQSPFFSAVLESFAMTMDYDYREDRLPLSDSELRIGRIVASNPLAGAAIVFSLDGLGLTARATENDAATHVTAEIVYSLDDLVIPNVVSLSDTALGLVIGPVETEAVQAFAEMAAELPLDASEAEQLQIMLPVLDRFLASNPTIALDPLRFSMPEGSVDGRASVTIDSSALPPGGIEAIAAMPDPTALMGAISCELDLTASKPLVEMFARLAMIRSMAGLPGPDGGPMPPDQLAALADQELAGLLLQLTVQNILVDTGGSYTTSIRFADGAATANGEPLPLLGF